MYDTKVAVKVADDCCGQHYKGGLWVGCLEFWSQRQVVPVTVLWWRNNA